jgi:hypothetical protein
MVAIDRQPSVIFMDEVMLHALCTVIICSDLLGSYYSEIM